MSFEQHNWPGFPGPPWGWGPPPGFCEHCHQSPCNCGSGTWPPPCPPGPGWDWNWRPPHGAIVGPIIGVTDGSQAKPGEVGEFLSGIIPNTDVPMPPGTAAGANATGVAVVTPLVIPPGDWDVTSTFRCGNGLNQFEAQLTPLPAGFSIGGLIFAIPEDTMRFFDWTFNGARLQANVTVPTAVVYTVTLGMVGGLSENSTQVPGSGGFFQTIVTARRMR